MRFYLSKNKFTNKLFAWNIYIYIYIYILKHVLLKTMERRLLFLIVIFQVLLFFLCRDPSGKGIVL